MNLFEPLRSISNIKLPNNIIFGIDAINQLGETAQKIASGDTLIIADDLMKHVGIINRVEKPLQQQNISFDIFTDISPDPTIECANKVVEMARKKDYSLVIGVGGGSNLDMAKIAAAMITNDGHVSDYIGIDLIKKSGIPFILIPTTSGTGSEVTANAIVSSKKDLMKKGIVSHHLFPTITLVDPVLTVSCPPKLTAFTGLDALTHNIEGFMALRANPFSDALALQATQLVFQYLPKAYSNGSDIEARYYMSFASMLGGLVIQGAGTCGGHAAAYAFAVKHNIPHGLSCAVALPYLMEFNAPACLEKIATIGTIIDDTRDDSLENTARHAIIGLKKLMKKINCPTSLRELNIPKNTLSKIAKDILKATRLLDNNPRSISPTDAKNIFEKMWEGSQEVTI